MMYKDQRATQAVQFPQKELNLYVHLTTLPRASGWLLHFTSWSNCMWSCSHTSCFVLFKVAVHAAQQTRLWAPQVSHSSFHKVHRLRSANIRSLFFFLYFSQAALSAFFCSKISMEVVSQPFLTSQRAWKMAIHPLLLIKYGVDFN